MDTLDILRQKSVPEIKLMNEQVNKLMAENKLILKQEKLTDEKIKTEKETQELIDAQTYTEISKDGLLEEQIAGQQTQNEILDEEKKQSEYNSQLLALKAKFSEITGIPLDTPEFLFSWNMAKNGTFMEYVNYCVNRFNENFFDASGKVVGSLFSPYAGSSPKQTGHMNPSSPQPQPQPTKRVTTYY